MGKKFILVILLAALAVVVGVIFWSEPELPPQARQKAASQDEPVDVVPVPEKQTGEKTSPAGEERSGSDREKEKPDEQPEEEIEDDTTAIELTTDDTVDLDTNLNFDPVSPDLPDTVVHPRQGSEKIIEDATEVDQTELAGRMRLKAQKLDPEKEAVQDTVTMRLLEKQSEITTGGEKFYTVEFWQTPFNTAGYKMGNLKLLMYGVDYDNAAEMYEYQDTFYLRNFNNFYQLRPSFKMQPLKTVDSTHVLFDQLKNNE